MFRAIGVGVIKRGNTYDVKVDYFDDRQPAMIKVTTLVHNVTTQQELVSAVQLQLQALKAADQVSTLSLAVTGEILGTI